MKILSLNCWSQSVNYHLFDWSNKAILAKGTIDRVVVGDATVSHQVTGRGGWRIPVDCPDHHRAIEVILGMLVSKDWGVLDSLGEIYAIGHRVAHGGEKFTRSVLIDDDVVAAIREVEHLAPLHNGPNLAGIDASRSLLPRIPQAAIFDTAFHQSMHKPAYIYPLPYEWYERYGVRRYGFHGASHLFMAKRAAVLLGKPPAQTNLITVHLGSGVSLCAVRDGLSVDTSMGMTPLEGPIMNTRCGDIDAGISSFIMQSEHLSARDYTSILNQKSGFFGITGGMRDRRQILEHAAAGNEQCRLAMEMEGYRLKKYIGGYHAAIGRLDALVFSSNYSPMGWNVRENALSGLDFLGIRLDRERNLRADREGGEMLISAENSKVQVYAMPVSDGLVFAEDVVALIAGTCRDHMQHEYSFSRPDFVMPWKERD
ncbi:acetate/propionate family kinase [Trichloromonas sp.]|uniref:acetate/propionate family kinase n=1 Tax=Trichloromonas sp. TaxID=3069249 RepID=UPI003D8140AA